MAANIHPEIKKDCYDAGMNGFLGKPVRINDFEEQIL